MPGTNYTTNLRLANPSLNDTGWGTTVSSGMIDLTDQAIAGLATADVTSSDVTLTIVDGSAGTNSARNMFLNITGTPGVARDVIVPTNRKLYFVTNNCGQIATVKVSGQPGVAVPAGASMTLRINAAGTDVAPTFTYAASMSLGTALPATSGGTGQSSFAIGDLLYASSTTAISKLTVGATNAVLTVAAGIPTWTPTLSAVSGGTGQSSFAVGDLLYASSTTAISKLTVGATDAVLTVAAGIPSWVATLPVASGGTGQTTAATAFDALKQSATTSYVGAVQLATTAEVQTGTDAAKPITPSTLRGGALVRATVQNTTSGTAIDFTGIPSWVKRIVVMFFGVSTNGSTRMIVQLGTSGGIETTNYFSSASYSNSAGTFTFETTGLVLEPTGSASPPYARYGSMVIENVNSNSWVSRSTISIDTGSVVPAGAGGKTLAGTLDRLRITTVGAADTFDGGSVNIMYE